MKKQCDKIRREEKTLSDRKIEGCFEAHFEDKSFRTEEDTNWSDICEEKIVKYGFGTKTVLVSKIPLSKIIIKHGEMQTEIEVSKGCRVYQAIRSRSVFSPSGDRKDIVMGRVVGIIKNDTVIEERFLNALSGEITGFRL